MRGGSHWDPRTQDHWPIALYLSFKFIGLFRSPALLPMAIIPLSLASFIYSGSILVKPKVCILTFSNIGHSHRMCTDVSFSAPHLLHEAGFCSPHLVQHVLQIDMPGKELYQHSAMFPVQFTYELYIPISWSLQTQLAGPILFTDFPFCLFPFSNPIPYFGLKSAEG